MLHKVPPNAHTICCGRKIPNSQHVEVCRRSDPAGAFLLTDELQFADFI